MRNVAQNMPVLRKKDRENPETGPCRRLQTIFS